MFSHLGIIAPTAEEASVLLGRLSPDSRMVFQDKTFFARSYAGGTKVTICICGIGKTNAAHGTTLLIERFGPELICMIGIGGGYPSAGLSLGDIVAAEREVYGDEGLESTRGFVTMEGLGLPLLSEGSLLRFNEMPLTIPAEFGESVRTGPFVTVSSCTGTLWRGIKMEQRYPGALCENMEGAAFAHVCRMNRVRAAEVRAISNIIEDRTPGGLDRNGIARASSRVQDFLTDTLLAGLLH